MRRSGAIMQVADFPVVPICRGSGQLISNANHLKAVYPAPHKGAFRIVTDVRRDAVDADGAQDERA